MKRILLSLAIVVSLAMMSVPATVTAAQPDGTSRVIPLGMALHKGRLVEGFAFVHGRDASSQPSGPDKSGQLYTFLARGAKWRSIEPYVVNPDNGDGVAARLISDAVAAAASTWEAQVPGIFGKGSVTNEPLSADWTAPDDVNEVYFSQTELGPGTVAVTIVWGVFSGPVSGRELIEWDLIFNDALPEPWGDATAQSGSWDVWDIATHELGHSAGLGDLYKTAAREQTMFGYASPGETKKRTLESGDIAGIRALYQ